MLKNFREMRVLSAFAKKQSVGMQRKLTLYWVSMVLVVFGILFFALAVTGVFSREEDRVQQALEIQLRNTSTYILEQMENLTARSLNLLLSILWGGAYL
jgi:F0F1-type ATP synthase membrane subunit a